MLCIKTQISASSRCGFTTFKNNYLQMKIRLLFFLLLCTVTGWAQLKSPSEFLGHTVGTKLTPHWKLISYYKHVAEQSPKTVRMQQYGTTNEGRPLYVAFISSESNINRLEEIRQNNLRLAHSLNDGKQADEQTPPIIWMSNNVHGNESSSAEASMLTLYDLVNPANQKAKQWLDKTVIVIDPCLNPDGTDRYVNWYNSVVGDQLNARRDAREHHEPWPGGRPNHYYFDLNRDWAWQTQVESQQRVAFYNKWLPQVHVDFHEQGINNPYFFPPAAEPLHEVITPWQRAFQETIGRFNARYFDEKGWLYFTKERFDLFYPSYGDTYPTYSGSIGMTYEQAGNGSAGLGVITDELDTLTLVDRAIHHHASGINIVQVSAEHAPKLIKEFRDFYNQAVNGKLSSYQSYVIKYEDKHAAKLNALRTFLKNNDIQTYTAKGSFKGYNYTTAKEESYACAEKDLVIPANQPKAALIRVLFEPHAKLNDSVTYDITAWAMPYVYGLEAYATKSAVALGKPYESDSIRNQLSATMGYAMKWNGFAVAQITSELLKKGYAIKYSEEPFTIGNEVFPSGSVVILKKGNEKFANTIAQELTVLGDRYQIRIHSLQSSYVDKGRDFGSPSVVKIKAPKVAMFTGEGTSSINSGEIWHYFDRQLKYPITLINVGDYDRTDWSKVDVLILPSGKYPFLKDKAQSEQFTKWIQAGGKVIAMQTAVDQLSSQSWSSMKLVKKDTILPTTPKTTVKYGDRERNALTNYTAGAIFKLTIDPTHPLMFGYESYYTLKQDDKIYQFAGNDKGWNVGYIGENARTSGFVGEKLTKYLKNGVVFAVQSVGKGSVTYLTDDIIFRNFWENGKLMMANATFFVGNAQ